MVSEQAASERFYHSAVPMESLEEFDAAGRFVQVPNDWYAAVTDVIGSTDAIACGRYKDVNLIGAAAIPALIEGLGQELPYIFNGDGVLVLVPGAQREEAEKLLSGLVYLAQANFKLRLRAALFNIGELRSEGYELEMGLLKLVGQQTLAQFRGSMVSAFDERIRRHGIQMLRPEPEVAAKLSLNSLSCRWHAQPSRNGEILSILLLPRDEKRTAISEFLQLLNEITDGELSMLNPVAISLTTYQSFFEAIRAEKRLHAQLWSRSFLRRFISICISVPLFKWGLSQRYDWAEHYLKNLSLHSDYHKLDEALRLVIDCSAEQSERVRQYLNSAYKDGALNYGVHRSNASQMTCYVESLNDAAHVHFVDGCNGGYVAAAAALKAQLEQDNEGKVD